MIRTPQQVLAAALFLLISHLQLGLSQDNPVTVDLSIFVVSVVGGEETFTEATEARPGQVVEYRLTTTNAGDTTLPPSSVSVTGPIPDTTLYVPDSATPSSDTVLTEVSVSGDSYSEPDQNDNQEAYSVIRWTLLNAMEPGDTAEVSYRVTVSDE